ncbi:MAG: Phosphopantetheine adenylyltransferase [Fimbriimonadales bacterium]|nr:MAG: pantetheine-phosphate adenylyltransferase [Armatimonadota bacterium]MBV6502087.1 Phosphopantetheine adenylyltransferase [Fimbriimonadales bacterium]MCE7898921.1 pantetheine-phosphate adenylyltransferase [Armatimonadetes bacterium ATM1]MDL1927376.1 pantetheine-phosphate adenylyltransferase [Fimbriimonadia bacterium ATM]MBC6969652.1 pantetheine-phosphate adenylyltransferase [Armatimonadota bacterium]
MRTAVYPGSFDPPTNGHLDLIVRAAGVFDRLIVAVGENPAKSALLTSQEKVDLLREVCAAYENVEVRPFSGLLVTFARSVGATAVVRGLRAVSDFEYEFQMALTNRALDSGVETVFMATSADTMFVSSSLVKEVAALGGDVSQFVPPAVARCLAAKLGVRAE